MSRPANEPPPDEARRRLFRRMEWVYVWAPPLLILMVGASGSLLLAWLVPVAGLGLLEKWLIGMAIIVGLPLAGYLLRAWWTR